MPVSASLNLISLVAEPGVLHYTKLFLNFLTLAVAGIFLCVRAGVTQVGSMKLALFFKQGLDFDIICVEPALVVSGNRAGNLEGCRVNRRLQVNLIVTSSELSQFSYPYIMIVQPSSSRVNYPLDGGSTDTVVAIDD